MKIVKSKILILALMLISFASFSQSTVKGILVDAQNNETLIGASVVVEGTTIGTSTALDGSFSITVPSGNQKLILSYVGYVEIIKDVNLTQGEELDLGKIDLEPSSIGLEEVRVISSFAKDRETPVAISTIKPELIQEKLGTQEYPEILKSTPSVYATKQGGGYGDSRIYLRGFDSNNIGVLINGVPVNDMESGKVYWSNWAGLSDVTESMQVQRGLGASKLALSSVGGTINILTKSTDVKKGGSVFSGIAHDGFKKTSVTLSTGLLDNGWAITFSGGKSSGDGYVQATNFEAWSYFANISKIINDKHRVSLTAFGAPQWHNQRGNKHTIQDYRDNPNGAQWNSDFGYRNGEIYNTAYAYNYYHKPQVSLNHYWVISEDSKLSTSAYASISKGGGRRAYGDDSHWLYLNNKTGLPYPGETKLTSEGYIDYDAVVAENANASNGSTAIMANSINSHDWYGVLSTYTKDNLIPDLKMSLGFDGRYYKGYHAYEIDDLLGGEYFLNSSNVNRDPNKTLQKGDYINYYNLGEVLWAGLFLQGEYVKDNYSGFLSLSGANNSYRRTDYFTYTPEEGQVTDWLSFWTYTVKGGLNYNINKNHNVYANGGYITRAPYFRNAFLGYTNDFNDDAKNEKIFTVEVGYGYSTSIFSAKLNVYRTEWKDKGLVKSFGDATANIPGINALHQGVEFEATYQPFQKLTVKGMFSWGDWIWTDDVDFELFDQNQVSQGTFDAYLKDVHVGNSAQITGALSVNYEILPKLKIGGDFNYFGKNFSDFNPENRTSADDRSDAWQLPDAYILDLNLKYRFKVAKLNATIYANINNILDTEYIADATDGVSHDNATTLVWYGFGRTWSTGLKINF
jgi:outer membrane receptor for ferrienterochelin and colicin